MAGDPLAVPILIGLGVTELSVAIPAIPTIKDRVRSLDLGACRRLADLSLAAADATEVRRIVSDV